MVFFEERLGKILQALSAARVLRKSKLQGLETFGGAPRYIDIDNLAAYPFAPYDAERKWGGEGITWFRMTARIPEDMAGLPVRFALSNSGAFWDAVNPQVTVYVDGVLRQGFDTNHRSLALTPCAEAGREYQIVLSVYTGDNEMLAEMGARLEAMDVRTERFFYDVRVPWEAARLLERDNDDYIRVISTLNEAINLLDLRKVHSPEYFESLARAQEYLSCEFYEKVCHDMPQKVYCVGHTHIDVAWWWTLRVTQDKAVRSFSTVLELMDEYPEYLFMSSQPQLYKYVREFAPEVYARIKERVRDGRWEPEGAMFVEADCNLSSGESLVRQILHGKRFFRQEFGKDCKILWLPDVFGYSAALPQIMQKSGIRYFMTTKISWNEFNKLPYDTFDWEGIDGTRILTHFSPSRDYNLTASRGHWENAHFTTYNAFINPSQVKGAWQRYQQKDINQEVLMTFGYGDGGGGPTREMLENQRRLAKGLPGCPQTVMATSEQFFETLEKNVRGNRFLPAWVGELYLEYHRGTYTGMARNKRFNRKSEFAYENAELYSVLADAFCGVPYEKARLTAGWEVLERNQFHDILPGSSIKQVYEDSKVEYEGALAQSASVTQGALSALAGDIAAQDNALVVFNPGAFASREPVMFDLPEDGKCPAVLLEGEPLPTQAIDARTACFLPAAVPAKGWRAFELGAGEARKGIITFENNVLETPYYRVTFNDNAQFTSVFDKRAARELLKAGERGNVLMSYEDRPHNYDAWDVNNYYTEKSWEIDDVRSFEVVSSGAVLTRLRVVRKYLDSFWTQEITFYEDSPRIDFDNVVDWVQEHIFVKALFPVDVQASEATYEIQYGHVKRPTHYNTSWDFARFEVCHHKWLDFSEDGYGVSVLNDCKYGAHVHDGVIGLSLLKCATEPNPDADKDRHVFRYSLLPHQGAWREARVLQNAYAVNNPPEAVFCASARGGLPTSFSMVACDKENVVCEVVKQAEDGQDVIVRVYEAFARRTDVCLTLGLPFASARECDLMEENETPVTADGRSMYFTLKPFEIKTFKVTLQ